MVIGCMHFIDSWFMISNIHEIFIAVVVNFILIILKSNLLLFHKMIKPLTFKYFFMLDHQQTIKRVLGLTNIKEIAAGSNHSIAINDQGIWTWGKADSFNLGV